MKRLNWPRRQLGSEQEGVAISSFSLSFLSLSLSLLPPSLSLSLSLFLVSYFHVGLKFDVTVCVVSNCCISVVVYLEWVELAGEIHGRVFHILLLLLLVLLLLRFVHFLLLLLLLLLLLPSSFLLS